MPLLARNVSKRVKRPFPQTFKFSDSTKSYALNGSVLLNLDGGQIIRNIPTNPHRQNQDYTYTYTYTQN